MKEDLRRFIAEVRRNPFLSLIVVVVFLLMTSVSLLPAYRGHIWDISPQKAGEFGDFIGGYFGPILSLIAIFFVVLTLREQRETSSAERRAEEVEGFENRFYRLIDLHRANVSEMSIGSVEGRRLFTKMLEEIRRALGAISQLCESGALSITTFEKLQVAYLVVFFGVGPNSSPALLEAIRETGIELDSGNLNALELLLNRRRFPNDPYYYFDGHQQRLGHYYRHLFQSISIVSQQRLIEKRSYAKSMRAQLSTHEQLLLLINSFTSLGWRWWQDNLIIEYGMVKNLPKGMMESICPQQVSEIFPKGYFEWERTSGRPQILNILADSPQE
jgi:hypothetical protein